MTIEERMMRALTATGIPVTQRPVTGTGERYISFDLTSGMPDMFASNDMIRFEWLMTVDLFTRTAPISSDIIAILKALREEGFMPVSCGPSLYESDTRWHHFPMSLRIAEEF